MTDQTLDLISRPMPDTHPLRSRITALFLAQRDRWFLWTPVFYGLGIGLYFSLPAEPALTPALIVLAGGILLGRMQNFTIPALVFVFVAGGFATAKLRTDLVAAPVIAKKTRPAAVEGRVAGIEHLPSGYRMVLDRLTIENLAADKTPEKIRLTVRGKNKTPPAPGSRVETLAVLNPPSPPVAPGAFDFQRHAFFQRLGGYGYTLRDISILAAPEQTISLESVRETIITRLEQRLGKNDTSGIAAALITGKRKAVSDSMLEDIRRAGIAHLLAISGLHVGLIAGFVFFITRAGLAAFERVALRYPIKKISAGAALLAAIGYMLLVGAPVPTQRAVLMTGIVMIAVLFDRQAISLRLAAIAALVVLLISPESLMGASFQMSFAAVVVLIAAYESLRPLYQKAYAHSGLSRRAVLYIGGVLLTTILASLATAPFAIFHFQRVAVWHSLIANMAAVPLTGFVVMPAGLIAVLLIPLGLEGPALDIMGLGIEQIMRVAHWASAYDQSVFHVPAWPVTSLVLCVLGGLWLLLWRGPLRLPGLVPIALGLVFAVGHPLPDVLISDDARLMAVKTADGSLSFSDFRKARFVRENWARMYGDPKTEKWPEAVTSPDGLLSCDSYGCVYTRGGKTVALAQDPMALKDDCRKANVVLSVTPVRGRCHAPHVIDRFDVWRNGAYAIYLNENIKIVSDRDIRGDRPWVIKR